MAVMLTSYSILFYELIYFLILDGIYRTCSFSFIQNIKLIDSSLWLVRLLFAFQAFTISYSNSKIAECRRGRLYYRGSRYYLEQKRKMCVCRNNVCENSVLFWNTIFSVFFIFVKHKCVCAFLNFSVFQFLSDLVS